MRTPLKFSLLMLGLGCLASVSFADEEKKPDQEKPAKSEVSEAGKQEKDQEKPKNKNKKKGHQKEDQPAVDKSEKQKPDQGPSIARVDNLFKRLDADHDGAISREEFGTAATLMHEHLQQAHGQQRGHAHQGHSKTRGGHGFASRGHHRHGGHRMHHSYRGRGWQQHGNFSHRQGFGRGHQFAHRGQFGRNHQSGFHGRHGARQGSHFQGEGRGFGPHEFQASRGVQGHGPRGNFEHHAFHHSRMAFHGHENFDHRGGTHNFSQHFGQHGPQHFQGRGMHVFGRGAGPQAFHHEGNREEGWQDRRPSHHDGEHAGPHHPGHPQQGPEAVGEHRGPPRDGGDHGARPHGDGPRPEANAPRGEEGERNANRPPRGFDRGNGPGRPERGPRMNRDGQRPEGNKPEEAKDDNRKAESSSVPTAKHEEVTMQPPVVPMPELLASVVHLQD